MSFKIPSSDEFLADMNALAETLIGLPSTQHTENLLRTATSQLIHAFYQIGGMLADGRGVPITDFDDVEIVITREAFSMSISIVRRTP